MKTRFKKLFLLAIVFLTPNLVNAESACTYEQQAELNNIVANVKASYEVVDIYAGKIMDIDNVTNSPDGLIDYYIKGFNINILNITDDVYVQVSNNYDGNVQTFREENTNDGIATFQTRNKDRLITYTFSIYSNKYSCVGEKFREFTITTPMYNQHSELQTCVENPDFYYCQQFISSDNISFDEFISKINDYKKEQEVKKQEEEEKNKSFIEKLKEFYQNNKVIVYSIGVIIVAGVATTVILVKKKRSRVL